MTMHRSAARRNRRRATDTSAPRSHNPDRRAPTRELPGRGRVIISGPGAVEFLRILETGGAP